MIFVTVGAQMPFDRLVRAVDRWADTRNRTDLFAQIGHTQLRPGHIAWETFLAPAEFRRRFESASVVVAHAGMGSIITALELGKPILVMPRRASLHEARNDHQVATAEQFQRYDSVAVAWDETELMARLDAIDRLQGRQSVGAYASQELLEALRTFINGAGVASRR